MILAPYCCCLLGILEGHIVRGTVFDGGLYDGLNLTTIGFERTIQITVDNGSKTSKTFILTRPYIAIRSGFFICWITLHQLNFFRFFFWSKSHSLQFL